MERAVSIVMLSRKTINITFLGDPVMGKCRLLILVISVMALAGSAYSALPVTDGLVMDLDADSISGVSDGEGISTWSDLSSAGNDATQATADKQPTYDASNEDFAGHATVHFDGSNDWMELPSTTINVGSFTMFAVGKYDNLGSNQYIVAGQDGGGNDRIRFQLETKITDTPPQFLWRAGSSGWTSIITLADTDVHVFGETSAVEGFLDGASIAISSNSSTENPTAFNIGSYNRGEKDFFAGDLAELIIYDRVLTPEEITSVSEYLDIKWSSFYVTDPSPENGETGVALDITLTWNGTEDPSNPGQLDPNVMVYYVWMDEDATDDDPNLIYQGTAAIDAQGGLGGSYGPLSLDYDQVVTWQIEEGLDDGQGGAFAYGDPNNMKGGVWSFTALASLPVYTLQPENTYFEEGDASVTLTVAATTGYPPLSYEWYKDGSTTPLANGSDYSGADTDSLEILLPDLADEGQYYCKAIGTNDGATNSDTVIVRMKRMVAEYKFEQDVDDSVSGYNGTVVNGPLEYTTDVVALDGQAYAADPNGGNSAELPADAYPKTGFGNALEEGSVAFWVKLDETMNFTQAVIGSFNDGSTSGFLIETPYTSSGIVRLYWRGENGSSIDCRSAGVDILDNQWHYVVIAYNANNGSGSNATVYFDGEPAGTATGSTMSFETWQYPLHVLARNSRGTIDEHLSGALDDLQIYNYELAGTQVAQNFYNVTGQKSCILDYASSFDVSGPDGESDCVINLYDFAEMASVWMDSGLYPIMP